MKRLAIMLFVFGLVTACSPVERTSQYVPKTPPQEIHRTDLPASWFEVKDDHCSYGLSPDFKLVNISSDNDVKTKYVSEQQNLEFNFMKPIHVMETIKIDGIDVPAKKRSLSNAELEDFVVVKFIDPIQVAGRYVIEVRERAKPFTVIAVHSLTKTQDSAFLDFFATNRGMVYQLSFKSDSANLQKHAQTCFDILRTLSFQ